mgnify:CR=1 FL=1
MIRKFHLERLKDISGISGCGVIAEGVEFSDTKQCVLHWIGEHSCTNFYASIEDIIYIHGHGGCTKVVFDE